MKNNHYYHIHINVFQISEKSRVDLIQVGFFYDPFVPLESSYAPPEHYSCETHDKELMKCAWKDGLEILKNDDSFIGYIEQEILSNKYSVNYSNYKFFKSNLGNQFPLPKFMVHDVPPSKHKHADLHVKRDKATPRDKLDDNLLASGFYEVWTPRNRIFTLQLECTQDAKSIFTLLKKYFNLTGGIKQLNFEVIGNLVRFPKEFKMAKYLPKIL